MARSTLVLYSIFGVVAFISGIKVYRTDYEYNRRTDAFYKLHIEGKMHGDARTFCQVEGASLMAPNSHQDIVQLHGMFKKYPDLGDYVWVAEDGQNHESAEEQPIIDLQPHVEELVSTSYGDCDAVSRTGEIETVRCGMQLPFICKVDARDAIYNAECNVYGKDYRRAQNVNSCYKIPLIAFTWNQAYAECAAEGAHLVVLNSQAEHDEVKSLMNAAPSIDGAHVNHFFHAGFRAQPPPEGTPRVFKTIFNETLEEAGFSTWAPNEPNNAFNNENCGTLFKNDGNLNDVECKNRYGFICEKELA